MLENLRTAGFVSDPALTEITLSMAFASSETLFRYIGPARQLQSPAT